VPLRARARGTIKEGVGKAVGNERMQNEGKLDQGKGQIREGVGNVRDNVDRAANDLKRGH